MTAEMCGRTPSRRWRRLLILAVLVLAGGFAVGSRSWRGRTAAVGRAGGSEVVLAPSAMTVAPGVHMLGGLSPSAAYVVETSEGLVLIDSGLDRDAARLKSQMAGLGLDSKRIRAVFLTHAHGDHTGGAEQIRSETGAKVYAGQGDCDVLRAGGPREAFFSTFFMPNDEPHTTTVDVPLEGGEVIPFGDVTITAIAAPGHTPGSVCYLAGRNGFRVFFGGDVVMMLRGDEPPKSEIGKPIGTYSAYLPPRYRGDASTFLESLRRLKAMPAPDLVLPGHPSADLTPENPRISPDRWAALLDGGIRDMETLLARYKADGADFLDGRPKILRPDLVYLGEFGGAAVYGRFAGPDFFLFDAAGGPGLPAFVDKTLRELGQTVISPRAVFLTSADPQAIAGLATLVENTHCQVVGKSDALSAVRGVLPADTVFVSTDGLAANAWFPVDPITLKGRGVGAVGYRMTMGEKTVLVSGRTPIKLTQKSGEVLIADLTTGLGDPVEYRNSLAWLRDLKPDLWLPSHPEEGQNANLYDRQWEQVIADNLFVLKHVPVSPR